MKGSLVYKHGRYYVVIRQKWIALGDAIKTKKQAEAERIRLVHEFNTGTLLLDQNMTLDSFLLEHWLPHIRQHVSLKTFERYEEIVCQRLVPQLGKLVLAKPNRMEVQSVYDEWAKSQLSPQTLRHYHRVLKNALGYALESGLLARDFTRGLKLPKVSVPEMQCLDQQQARVLLQAAREANLYVPTLLALMTGLRRGELLGLRWQDVDFSKDGGLFVRQSLEQTRGEKPVDGGRRKSKLTFKDPKTSKSRRFVPLDELELLELKKHRIRQNELRLQFGSAYRDHDLVFCKANGQPMIPDVFTRSFMEMASKAGFRGLRLHDLRHTHASQLLREGVAINVVAKRLGHSSPKVTLDRYIHVLEGMDREAVAKLSAAYARIEA